MPDDLHYALEKLNRALYHLAVGPGDIRERLRSAAPELAYIRVASLPEGIREEFEAIIADLTKKAPERWQDGRFEATLFGMRKATGARLAERLWALHYRLGSHLEPGL
jgi:hypothetical protein